MGVFPGRLPQLPVPRSRGVHPAHCEPFLLCCSLSAPTSITSVRFPLLEPGRRTGLAPGSVSRASARLLRTSARSGRLQALQAPHTARGGGCFTNTRVPASSLAESARVQVAPPPPGATVVPTCTVRRRHLVPRPGENRGATAPLSCFSAGEGSGDLREHWEREELPPRSSAGPGEPCGGHAAMSGPLLLCWVREDSGPGSWAQSERSCSGG